jgi:hypothetical protein
MDSATPKKGSRALMVRVDETAMKPRGSEHMHLQERHMYNDE